MQALIPMVFGMKSAGAVMLGLAAVTALTLKAYLASKLALAVTVGMALKKLYENYSYGLTFSLFSYLRLTDFKLYSNTQEQRALKVVDDRRSLCDDSIAGARTPTPASSPGRANNSHCAGDNAFECATQKIGLRRKLSVRGFARVNVECVPSFFTWRDLAVITYPVLAFNADSGTVLNFNPSSGSRFCFLSRLRFRYHRSRFRFVRN
ncbi:hypothetical protein EVAR_12268_1 [Eumeta japonica]|uniref:Uncharacterized protein n=1 Tax=Eumeta variegata TaxID=151549 RepID=A0A4C1TUH2_EUMVA|nr:hypothetical protein EVAR_12268_1 [Eumeta japonica]